MCHADYLIPTTVPGLSVRRGQREVIHDASGQCVATLPAGLSRPDVTGVPPRQVPSLTDHTGALAPLCRLDWQGPLTAQHQALLDRVTPAYATVEGTLALIARQRRIEGALRGAFQRFLYSPRGKAVGAAYQALAAARALRAAACDRVSKAAATRAEKDCAAQCAAAGVSVAALDLIADRGRGVHPLMGGLVRREAQWRALTAAREERLDACRRQATRFMQAPAQAQWRREVTLCLTATGGGLSFPQATFHYPNRRNGERSALHRANVERVRRVEAGLSLSPADPELRALTRPYRVRAAQGVLLQWRCGTADGQKILDTRADAFYRATQFKSRKVRRAHLQHELDRLEADFPCLAFRTALLRGIRRKLPAMARQRWGRDVDLSELPAAPRWAPGSSLTLTAPPIEQGGTLQPSLF